LVRILPLCRSARPQVRSPHFTPGRCCLLVRLVQFCCHHASCHCFNRHYSMLTCQIAFLSSITVSPGPPVGSLFARSPSPPVSHATRCTPCLEHSMPEEITTSQTLFTFRLFRKMISGLYHLNQHSSYSDSYTDN